LPKDITQENVQKSETQGSETQGSETQGSETEGSKTIMALGSPRQPIELWKVDNDIDLDSIEIIDSELGSGEIPIVTQRSESQVSFYDQPELWKIDNGYNAPDEDEDLQMTEASTFVRDSEKREESADEIPDFEPQDGTREEPDELNGDPDLILDEDRRARSQIKGKVGKNSKAKSSGYNAPDEDKDLQMTEAPTFVRDNEKREESADEIPALPSNGIHISESGDVLEELELPV
jgi:hypothetical protein